MTDKKSKTHCLVCSTSLNLIEGFLLVALVLWALVDVSHRVPHEIKEKVVVAGIIIIALIMWWVDRFLFRRYPCWCKPVHSIPEDKPKNHTGFECIS